jgi:hypothetical protein
MGKNSQHREEADADSSNFAAAPFTHAIFLNAPVAMPPFW